MRMHENNTSRRFSTCFWGGIYLGDSGSDKPCLYGLTRLFKEVSPYKIELSVGWPSRSERPGSALAEVFLAASLHAMTHLTIDSYDVLAPTFLWYILNRCSQALTHLSIYAPIPVPHIMVSPSSHSYHTYIVQLPRLSVLEYTSYLTSDTPFWESLVANAPNLQKLHVHSLDPNYSPPVKPLRNTQTFISVDLKHLRSDWLVHDVFLLEAHTDLSRVYPNVTVVNLRIDFMDYQSKCQLFKLHRSFPSLQYLQIDNLDAYLMEGLVTHLSMRAYLPNLKEICFRNQSTAVVYLSLATLLKARNVNYKMQRTEPMPGGYLSRR